ncbi:MAG: TlpA family protein disulfide reductase [Deltaproteobacteria bacterium]|nr:TlpA family protein disulfide reductase [Deltaproteobacteria bacterium]MBW2081781.1 TlpA family protein disulfide reductase [Deltaproteobacteria bacterium]HDM09135.1 TlpA family protein disulfide reductase [Desulfobacteraceae bacterium]
MKYWPSLALSIFVFFCLWLPSSVGQAKAPAPGKLLPRFEIPPPQRPIDAQYLGVQDKESFWITDIDAQLVIIEIFSMYCPFCQREAPRINELYEKIESDPQLKGKIKIIGVGAGNSPFEVNFFRKKFNVPFPMFPDNDFAIHKTLGEVRTPYFIVVSNLPDHCPTVIYSKLGSIKNMDEFLKHISKKLSSEAQE